MEERKPAIILSGVKKQYRLGTIGRSTLRAELQSKWAQLRGREDPNRRIGQENRLSGQSFMALNGIDLTVYQGERLGIIGANGAGKSTMLKLLARVTAPTEGEIDIWGRVASMLEVGTGFHGEMTGRENIYLNGAILGMTRAEIDARMEEIIAFSEVADFIDTPVKRYSSGMFVKLAFAVAAHLNNEIMIMDEVLAVGDIAFQTKCLDRMRRAAEEEGKTVLYVSHNMSTIRRLCERCIVMDRGKIIFDGDVEHAIAIYMDMGLGDNQVDIDLTEKSMAAQGVDSGVTMRRLLLLDKVLPSYSPGEQLHLQLEVRVTEPVSGCVFRLTILSDTDQPLGTCWSPELSFPEAGNYAIDLSVPLDRLEKGVFYGNIGLYHEDDIGRDRCCDRASRAFRFEVNGSPVWNTSVRGYSRLPACDAAVHRIDSDS